MHDLFIGQTGSGKTHLAKGVARDFLARGINVLVLNAFWNDWPATWETTDAEKFIHVAKRSRSCALFIDDVGETLSRLKDEEWPFTMGRHWGHKTHALGHGAKQLPPVVRNQCSRLFLFADTAPEECAFLASMFNAPGLLAASTMPKHSFLLKARGEPLRGPLMASK